MADVGPALGNVQTFMEVHWAGQGKAVVIDTIELEYIATYQVSYNPWSKGYRDAHVTDSLQSPSRNICSSIHFISMCLLCMRELVAEMGCVVPNVFHPTMGLLPSGATLVRAIELRACTLSDLGIYFLPGGKGCSVSIFMAQGKSYEHAVPTFPTMGENYATEWGPVRQHVW